MISPPPPYRPLRGAEPPHFADPEDEDCPDSGVVGSCLEAYRAGPSDPRFHRLVYGPSMSGKSVLLRAVARRVREEDGWAVALVRARSKVPLLDQVREAVICAWQGLCPEHDLPRLVAKVAHPSSRPGALAMAAGPGLSAWDALAQASQAAGRYCASFGRGLLVAVDDAHLASSAEVEALAHIGRHLARDQLPAALLMAAAPSVAARLDRWGGANEALWFTRLLPLGWAERREALLIPAAERGVEVEEEAVALLCRASGGNPLDLQRLALSAWALAKGPSLIGLADAELAVAQVCRPCHQQAS